MIEFITMAPTSGDGEYIGASSNATGKKISGWTGMDESAERLPTFEYIKAIAKAAEEGGFSTLLLPTGASCLDSLAVASNLINQTERLNFLFAIRPGSILPTTFAKQFATVDYWSGGRALINIVTGGSPSELASQGDFENHSARYRRTKEYIQVLKKLFTESQVTHEGEFFKFQEASLFPKPKTTPNIYFGGASDIGKEVAAKEADVYMMWGETLENTKQTIEEMKIKAAKNDRQLSYSISFQVILGETEEEAYEKANRILSKSKESLFEQKQEEAYKGESVGVRRLHELMESGKENDFYLEPNLWAGLTQVLSGNSIALVGTPEQVSDRIVEFVNLGFDKVLLRGFPHLETIQQVGQLVIPKVKEKLSQKRAVS